MKSIFLSKRLVVPAMAVALAFLESDCKPRRNLSSAAGAADELTKLKKNAEDIQQIVAQSEFFAGSATMGLPEKDINAVENDSSEPSQVKVARPFEMPGGCSEDLWNGTLEYDAPVFGRLALFLDSDDFDVRAQAVRGIAKILFAKNLHCATQLVENMMQQAFKDSPPPKELVRDEEKAKLVKWRCSNYIRCSLMFDVMAELLDPMRDSTVLETIALEAQVAAATHMVSKKAPIIPNLIGFRADFLVAQLKFYRLTRINTDFSVGKPLNFLAPEEFASLIKEFADLQKNYEGSVVQRFKDVTRYTTLVKPQFINHLTQEIFPDATNIYRLPPEERALQENAAKEYIASIPAALIQSYEYVEATSLYLNRLPAASPIVWLGDVKKGVALFKALRQKRKLLDLQDKRFEETDAAQIKTQAGNLSSGKPVEEVNPRIAIRALSAFFSHEVWLPYRADFVQAANEIYDQLEPAVRISVLPELLRMEKTLQAVEGFFGNSAARMAGLDGSGLNITEMQIAHYKEMRDTIQRISIAEPEIARHPKMVGFSSLITELREYQLRMVRRANAQQKFVQFFADDTTKPVSLIDRVVSAKSRSEAYRYFFAPGTGSDVLRFDVKHEHYGLIEQFLVIKCIDRIYGRFPGPNRYVIKERFVMEETDLEFRCDPKWNLSQLRLEALKYASARTQTEIEQHVWRAVRNSPFLHTAMMVGLSAVAGPAGAWIFRSAATYVGISSTLIQGALLGRNLLSIPKLVIDSYLFAVAEWGASKIIENTGQYAGAWGKIVYSAEELRQHSDANPFTNWQGALTGAVIFGAIPYVHHLGGGLAKGLLFKVASKPAPWLVHTFKGAGEFAGEFAFFRYQGKIMEKGMEFWQRLNLNYQDIDAETQLQLRMHGQSEFEQNISTLITVMGFSANRWGGAGVRELGVPVSLSGEINYIKLQIKDLLGKGVEGYENPYEILGLRRGATEGDIREATRENIEFIQLQIAHLTKKGVEPESQQITELISQMRLAEASGRILLSSGPGWSEGLAPEFGYLKVGLSSPKDQVFRKYFKGVKPEVGDADFIPEDTKVWVAPVNGDSNAG